VEYDTTDWGLRQEKSIQSVTDKQCKLVKSELNDFNRLLSSLRSWPEANQAKQNMANCSVWRVVFVESVVLKIQDSVFDEICALLLGVRQQILYLAMYRFHRSILEKRK
jgi:hypothetical protein